MAKILLVDDEKNVLMTLSIGLKRHSFDVSQASNGPAALEMLDAETFDFVVSDIRMSPMDGYTLATKIHEKFPDVGIVLMSAYGFEHKRHELGFPQVTKPFPISDLVDILHAEEERRFDSVNESHSGNILVFAEGPAREKIIQTLFPMGFQVNELEEGETLKDRLEEFPYDLFLVDESSLAEGQWKILNEIDQQAPHKPVVLLISRGGKRDHMMARDLSIAVLDREKFFSNPDWTRHFLLKRIG